MSAGQPGKDYVSSLARARRVVVEKQADDVARGEQPVRRSYLQKEQDNVKRFLQGLSESVLIIRHDRDRTVRSLMKNLKINRTLAEESYEPVRNAFSYPPRVGRKGVQGVLDIIQQQADRPKTEFAMSRFVDESILDELDKTGFFKQLESKYSRK